MSKPKFAVGQVVVTKNWRGEDAGFTIIRKVDADGTLYESAGNGPFLGSCITKISDVRPLTKTERGPR